MIYKDEMAVISGRRALRGIKDGRTDCVFIQSIEGNQVHINQLLVDPSSNNDVFVLPYFQDMSFDNINDARDNYEKYLQYVTNLEIYTSLKEDFGRYVEVVNEERAKIEKHLKGNVVIDEGTFKGLKSVNLTINGHYSTKICPGAFDEDANVTISCPEGMARMIVTHYDGVEEQKYMLIGQKELVGIKPISSAGAEWKVESAGVNEAGVFAR